MNLKLECHITEYREEKRITQKQLAEMVGVRRETIVRLEKGQYNPSLKLAMDIAEVLEVDIYRLFIFKKGD